MVFGKKQSAEISLSANLFEPMLSAVIRGFVGLDDLHQPICLAALDIAGRPAETEITRKAQEKGQHVAGDYR